MRTPFVVLVPALLLLLANACSDDALPLGPSNEAPINVVDASPDTVAPTMAECDFTIDCPNPPKEFEHCAEKRCKNRKCLYVTLDMDQDGHRSNRPCVAKSLSDASASDAAAKSDSAPPSGGVLSVEVGDDCDDNNVNLYPGREAICTELADGRPIMYPGGVPKGLCAAGKKSCTADGKVSPCTGAVAPRAEDCNTVDKDEDCDGSNVNACLCSGASTVPCGSAVGACRPGTQTCSSGAYGACVGAVGASADDCSATGTDLNCDGIKGNGANCASLVSCYIRYDWVRGTGCNGYKVLNAAAGNVPVYQCSDGQTPATIYLAQACPFVWEGYSLVGYVSPVSGGAGWIPLAGGYTLQ
jgi:hypothetical protein